MYVVHTRATDMYVTDSDSWPLPYVYADKDPGPESYFSSMTTLHTSLSAFGLSHTL